MKAQISSDLLNIIQASHKNLNYSLNFLLSSIDSDTCAKCMHLVEEFKLSGDRTGVEIDNASIEIIQQVFHKVDNDIIERLLWVSMLFPEI